MGQVGSIWSILLTQPIKIGLMMFEINPLKFIRDPTQFVVLRIGLVWIGVDGLLDALNNNCIS